MFLDESLGLIETTEVRERVHVPDRESGAKGVPKRREVHRLPGVGLGLDQPAGKHSVRARF